jgi:hypothetical protein
LFENEREREKAPYIEGSSYVATEIFNWGKVPSTYTKRNRILPVPYVYGKAKQSARRMTMGK